MRLSLDWLLDFVDIPLVGDPAVSAMAFIEFQDRMTSIGMAVEKADFEICGPTGLIDFKTAVLDFEITTNRPDAMNHYGVAREASALYDLPLRPIDPKLPAPQGKSEVTIEIQEPELCPRFTAREIRAAVIKPSLADIAHRLQLLDQRPISNAVDATNYVLWESGKPTHVFDLDLLEGRRLIIRRAQTGETLKTLDGVERKLTTEDLVVADAKKPVGLAGVMGGFDTMITERTKNILIESAWFDPVTVRRMSKRHGLHTDASHRFERGADFESTVPCANRVAELILASGGGTLIGGVIDVIARQLDLAPVELDLREVQRILGEPLSTLEINRILTRLGFTMLAGAEDKFLVHIPSWRLDIEREIDIIEELARLHGYDKFPNTLPAYSGEVRDLPDAHKDARLRSSLLALGYNEAISLTFISKDDARRFSTAPELDLANPLSDEASVMRTSLVPSMLNMLAYNLNRGSDNVRLFEAGNIFEASSADASVVSMPRELKRISIGATGNFDAEIVRGLTPGAAARPLTFFDLKGDVENLLAPFSQWTLYYDEKTADYYHPGRSARAIMDGATIAQFGQIHPDIAAARKLRQDVFIAEIYLDRLYQHDLRQPRYEALPRFPAVERDFSFVFDDSVEFEKIHESVSGLGIAELRTFVPVEIFRGDKVGAGKYSILMRAKFQSVDRTLQDGEITAWWVRIAKALATKLGGVPKELDSDPLASFFLSEYYRHNPQDLLNFADSGAFARYGQLFSSALKVLQLRKEDLRSYPQFNFDSADPGNLEGAVGELRVVLFLHERGFEQIRLLRPDQNTGADIICEKSGRKICFEVKTVTKQSAGREDEFLENQLYAKLRDVLPRASVQLKTAKTQLNCSLAVVVFVVNWPIHSMVLGNDAFQWVVNRIESEEYTQDVDGVVLLLAGGTADGFLSARAQDQLC